MRSIVWIIRKLFTANSPAAANCPITAVVLTHSAASMILRRFSTPGVMGPGRTAEGFGVAFGINHLGHFLLTNLLLERLQQCRPSRVVTVAALLHRFGTVDFPLLDSKKDSVSAQSTWDNFQAYCNSKLCNVLFTRELANRLEGTGVTCYSLHPGRPALTVSPRCM